MTPEQRIAAGYGELPDEPADRTRSRADTYQPEHDDEVARLRKLGDKVPTLARLAMGYHENAKRAAEAIENGDAAS